MFRRFLHLLLIAWPCTQALALSSMDPDSERALLRAQQQEIESLHTQRLAECAKRFEVNKCREQSAAERRARLAPIVERERRLDEEARANRALTQSLRSSARQPGEAASVAAQRGATRATGLATSQRAPALSAQEREARKAEQLKKNEEQAAERAQKALQRKASLDAHAKAVQERNARRTDKPAASLPIPTAASIAALPAASAASRR